MAGLPAALKTKLEVARTAEGNNPPAMIRKPRPATAVASMTPGPVTPPVPAPEGELDMARFAVEPQTATPGAPPSEAPRVEGAALTPEDEEAAFDAEWKARDPKGFHKYKTVAGMFERSKQDVRDLKDELSELKGEIRALRAAPAPAPAVTAPAKPLEDELDDTEHVDADGKKWSEKSVYLGAVPVVKKLGTRVAQEVFEQLVAPLQAEIAELKKGQENLGNAHFQTEEQSFVGQVRARVKDFDKIIDSPQWKSKMKEVVPYTDLTFGQALALAHNKRNLDGVLQIFASFSPDNPPNVDDLASPPIRANGSDPTRTPQKPILKASERRKASEDFRKKRITQEEFNRIRDLYTEAEKEGRINWNA